MTNLDNDRLQSVAFQMIAARNSRARQRVFQNHILMAEIPGLSVKTLESLGFSKDEIIAIKSRYLQAAEQEIKKARECGIDMIFKGEECYPDLLGEIFDPPAFIYTIGDKSVLKSLKIAVVGSRRPSSYGWYCLNRIIPDLCRAGLTIVSGMAYGIDSMSHRLAVREHGRTIGVNPGGLLHLYPPGNQSLIDEIAANGCIIGEFPLDLIPRPAYFPIRNRIISGMAQAVLVVEAAMRSGSLITARLALEQNREVMAVPGRIDSPLSLGTHYLIQQGARLVANAGDILSEFGLEIPGAGNPDSITISKKEKKVLDLIPINELKDIDYFVDNLDFSVSEIISLLMGLMLKNMVIEEAGGYRRMK